VIKPSPKQDTLAFQNTEIAESLTVLDITQEIVK
jgi:hypothetical protein